MWAQPDGTLELQQSAGPLRFKEKGAWREIDTALAAGADGTVAPKAHPLGVRLSDGGADGQLFSLGSGGHRVGQGWPGVLPQPVLEGGRALYKDVRPGLDVNVEVTRTGVQESFTVRDRDAARELESLALTLRGQKLSLKPAPDGGQDLVDGQGRELGEIGAAIAWDDEIDARSKEPEDIEPVNTRFKPVTDGAVMRLDLDDTFLADKDTRFPVTVDPAVNFGPSFDTFVQQGYTSDQSRATELKWGNNGSGQVARSLLAFNAAKVKGKQILKGELKFFNHHSWSCQARGWDVWSTGKSDASARWAKQPAWVKKYATSTQTKGPKPCNPGWITADASALVRDFAAAKQNTPLYAGVQASNEKDPYFWKRVSSAEGSNPPVLAVTYNTVPNTPARPVMVPQRADKTGWWWTTSTTPTATVTPVDADGGQLTVGWQLNKPGGVKYLEGTTKGASGTKQSWRVPAGKLEEDGAYAFKARVWDGHAWSGWSPWLSFRVLTAKPPVPKITSTDFPPNTWGGAPDGKGGYTGELTLTPSGLHRESLLWRWDNQPWKEIVTTSASRVKVTVPAGAHTVQAKTRNRAGLESAPASYKFLAGDGAALKSPSQGTRSARRTALDSLGSAQDTKVRYQWRRGATDQWKDVPVGDVRWAKDGKPVTAWPIDAPGGKPAGLTWNVADTLGENGTVEVRAVFTAGESTRVSPANELTLDKDAGQSPTQEVGPGTVNLLTGNFTLSETDASVWDMSIARTLASRRSETAAQRQGVAPVFGPGWLASTVSEISESDYTALRKTSATSVEVDFADEDGVAGIGFTAAPGGKWKPEPGAEDLTLTGSLTGNFTLTDTDGMATTFLRTAGTDTWQVASSYLPESQSTVRQTWEKTTVGGKSLARPRYVIAPTSAVSQATCETKPATAGCRMLEYVYAPATTAAQDRLGDVSGQVKEVRLWAADPGAAAATAQPVASYAYDATGRLREQWDPRISPAVKTRYSYDGSGHVLTHQNGSDQPWTMVYGKAGKPEYAGEGTLKEVRRPTLKPGTRAEVTGTAQTTLVYGVPLTGGQAPHAMGHADVNTWGQSDAPTDATAVFPPDQIPDSSNGEDLTSGSYRRATLAYINASGRQVNTAEPGGGITSTQYDEHGNTTWQLSAANRALTLGQGEDADSRLSDLQLTDASNDERAELLGTSSTYSDDGLRETDTREPLRLTALKNGSDVPARTWVHRDFDQGRPTDGTAKAKDLVTRERTAAEQPGTSGQPVEPRTTATAYDWTKGLPVTTVTDPDGLALTETTAYDAQGRVTKTTHPASNGNDAGTTLTEYWTATGSGGCAGRPEWADLTCKVHAAAPADQGRNRELPVTVTEYTRDGQSAKTTETANGATRTTVRTYDAAGRLTRTSIPFVVGAPVRDVTTEYDPATGRATTQRYDDRKSVRTTYDSLGRIIGYTDGHDTLTTTRHDTLDRPTEISDPSGTRTLAYDHSKEPRGLLTSVTDSMAGTLTGRYDLDGNLTEQRLPGDVTLTDTQDTTGDTTARTVTRGQGESTTTLLSDWQSSNTHGQWAARTTQADHHTYAHDNTGRLTGHDDTDRTGACTRTQYALDRNTNRTAKTIQQPDTTDTTDGTTAESCGRGQKSELSHTYDSADRLQDPGHLYDAFGRTTRTIDRTDSPGNDTYTGSDTLYFTNDLVHQQTSGDRRTTWTLDPAGRRDTATTATRAGNDWPTTGTQKDHFGDSGDNPAWSETASGTRTRYIDDIAGDLIAISTGDKTDWQFADLHDDVTTTLNHDTEARVHAYDPFGIPTNSPATPATPYGYLGAKQRSNNTPSGQLLMGARLYHPVTGRFLQTDPVPGGSANNYDYVRHAPLSATDLDGRFRRIRWRPRWPKVRVNWGGARNRFRNSIGGRAIRWGWGVRTRAWNRGGNLAIRGMGAYVRRRGLRPPSPWVTGGRGGISSYGPGTGNWWMKATSAVVGGAFTWWRRRR
ncbi:sugar-binding protein [Streptomyces kanamyceticus]|uniref:Sugar-binding protein n=3 Tax=Streptomyces kanamyceticus TaxID=1967 RepID=A0A5J6G8L7_STRKN|nr:RHS repeat-associated core domain-containing protein [Streptomyces kanamyceticus]QEU90131.1 sugar-binding protein [Streptomyces kanamyceticus]